MFAGRGVSTPAVDQDSRLRGPHAQLKSARSAEWAPPNLCGPAMALEGRGVPARSWRPWHLWDSGQGASQAGDPAPDVAIHHCIQIIQLLVRKWMCEGGERQPTKPSLIWLPPNYESSCLLDLAFLLHTLSYHFSLCSPLASHCPLCQRAGEAGSRGGRMECGIKGGVPGHT